MMHIASPCIMEKEAITQPLISYRPTPKLFAFITFLEKLYENDENPLSRNQILNLIVSDAYNRLDFAGKLEAYLHYCEEECKANPHNKSLRELKKLLNTPDNGVVGYHGAPQGKVDREPRPNSREKSKHLGGA